MECYDKVFGYLTNNFIINSLQIFCDFHENFDGIFVISLSNNLPEIFPILSKNRQIVRQSLHSFFRGIKWNDCFA